MPETQETQVQFLAREDPLEEGTATHSSIPAWGSPWTEEPGGLQSLVLQSPTQLKRLSTHSAKHRELCLLFCKQPRWEKNLRKQIHVYV